MHAVSSFVEQFAAVLQTPHPPQLKLLAIYYIDQ
jgi:hypothetical protein